MDTKKIEILLNALQTGSLLKTSETYGYTPSGLVHMMNALENELGIKLLHRGRYGIRPTAEAELLVPYFNELTSLDQKIRGEIHKCNQNIQKEIRIGAYTSIAKQWLPEIIHTYGSANPDISLHVRVGSRKELYRNLEDQLLDICFISYSPNYPCNFLPLSKDHLYAIVPRKQTVHQAETFQIKNMTGLPFIMPSYNQDEDVSDLLAKYNVIPQIKAMAVDDSVVLTMVSHDMGVSILSSLVIAGSQENISAIPLSPASYRQIGIATKKDASVPPHIKDFIQFIKNNPSLTYIG